MLLLHLSSQGLDVNAYGFDVKAPTGHKSENHQNSITLQNRKKKGRTTAFRQYY